MILLLINSLLYCVFIAKFGPRIWKSLQRIFIFKETPNMSEIYGKGSWALVTNISTELGQAWASALAKRGFNLIFFDDSKNSQEISDNLTQEFKIQTKIIQTDLSNPCSAHTYDQLTKQLSPMDISILVNNSAILPLNIFDNPLAIDGHDCTRPPPTSSEPSQAQTPATPNPSPQAQAQAQLLSNVVSGTIPQ